MWQLWTIRSHGQSYQAETRSVAGCPGIIYVAPCSELLWHLMACYGILWHVMASYGMLWHLMACYGILWHVMATIQTV